MQAPRRRRGIALFWVGRRNVLDYIREESSRRRSTKEAWHDGDSPVWSAEGRRMGDEGREKVGGKR